MKKVKNNSGATILMALLLILLATAVGAAVLTAAVSAARHLRSDREAQQNSLTVSSAAELIRDSINGQTYERKLRAWRRTTYNEETGEEIVNKDRALNAPAPAFTGPMGAWLSACIANSENKDYLYASLQECSDTITVALKGTPDLKQVKAEFSAQANGEIRVKLSLVQEDGKTEDDCRMTLTMQGTLTTDGPKELPTDKDYDVTCTTTVTWGSPKIAKGFADKGAGT